MPWIEGYEELREFLRHFTNIGGDPYYDTNGILSLLLALVDNLRECEPALANLPELTENVSADQAAFLRKLADSSTAANARPD